MGAGKRKVGRAAEMGGGGGHRGGGKDNGGHGAGQKKVWTGGGEAIQIGQGDEQ